MADPANGTPEAFLDRKRKSVAKTGRSMGLVLSDLNMVSQLAAWPTPDATNVSDGTPWEAQLAALQQRRADAKARKLTGSGRSPTLQMMAQAAWPTPKVVTGDYQYANGDHNKPVLNLEGAAKLARGQAASLSPAATASGGQLNPALSRWLQGYPVAWCEAAIRAHRSMPKRRPKRASSGCADTAIASIPMSRRRS